MRTVVGVGRGLVRVFAVAEVEPLGRAHGHFQLRDVLGFQVSGGGVEVRGEVTSGPAILFSASKSSPYKGLVRFNLLYVRCQELLRMDKRGHTVQMRVTGHDWTKLKVYRAFSPRADDDNTRPRRQPGTYTPALQK